MKMTDYVTIDSQVLHEIISNAANEAWWDAKKGNNNVVAIIDKALVKIEREVGEGQIFRIKIRLSEITQEEIDEVNRQRGWMKGDENDT
jgi:hypothetical protein